jgi:hypothetical protein
MHLYENMGLAAISNSWQLRLEMENRGAGEVFKGLAARNGDGGSSAYSTNI